MSTTEKPSKRKARRSTVSDDHRTGSDGGAAGDEDGRLTAQRRHEMISVAAYYRAECRGFEPGCEHEDWLAAEEEIDAMDG